MADVDKILRLVAEGRLSAGEADEILSALLAAQDSGKAAPARAREAQARVQDEQATRSGHQQPRHLRILVTERGRSVVNLRVPMNIASWASAYIPGLSEENADRIRGAIESGVSGPIIDIGDGDDRVLITSE
jgi:hypothetical protein